jgi:hypothetical protein
MTALFSSILGGLGKFGGQMGTAMGDLKGPLAILDMITKMQQEGKTKAALDRQIYYMKHPEVLANLTKQYERPLSTGLTTGVGNIVQAQMAERGLNMAPGIYGEVLSQALAPYQQKEQELALGMALKQMGLPGDVLQGQSAFPQAQGLAGLLSSLSPEAKVGTWSGGSVGGVRDPGLDTPQYMPPTYSGEAPPFDPTQIGTYGALGS